MRILKCIELSPWCAVVVGVCLATRLELEALLARSRRNMALLCMMRWLLSCPPPLGDIILAEGGIVVAADAAVLDFLRSVTIAERDFCTLVLKICILAPALG